MREASRAEIFIFFTLSKFRKMQNILKLFRSLNVFQAVPLFGRDEAWHAVTKCDKLWRSVAKFRVNVIYANYNWTKQVEMTTLMCWMANENVGVDTNIKVFLAKIWMIFLMCQWSEVLKERLQASDPFYKNFFSSAIYALP